MLKVNYIHKDKNAILIGNAIQWDCNPIDIYLDEKSIPATITIRMGNQPWNISTINVSVVEKIKNPKGIMLPVFVAYYKYQYKINQNAS